MPTEKSQWISSINPSTEEELGRIEAMSRDQVDEALQRSRAAAEKWRRVDISERCRLIRRLSDLILAEQQSIAELITLEQGKPLTEALYVEVLTTLSLLKDQYRYGGRLLQRRRIRLEQPLLAHKFARISYEPYGVVAVISPWNFPFSVPLPQITAALLAGNSVVFKPSPEVILIGRKIDELFRSAGFPENLVTTLFLLDKDAPYLTAHRHIDKIVFTGSTITGSSVMAAAAKEIKPVVLELGGKDAAIVAADADLVRAAKGIVWGAMFNAGQVCASVERVYVERPIAEKFLDLCLQEVKALKFGDPRDPETQVGPLTTLQQVQKVEEQVKDAVERGARVLFGGYRLKRAGFFFSPTLMTDVDHSMKIMREETFGPVLPIMAVDSLQDAVTLANDSEYGLTAYVWTWSRKTAARLAADLQAGTVIVNDSAVTWGEPKAPWGGVKKSGIGRTRGRETVLEWVQPKFTAFDDGGKKTNLWWFPYSAETEKLAALAGEALFLRKPSKLWKLIKTAFHPRFAASAHWSSVLRHFLKLF
ncbi:MAG: aldehyde dehydrogenase family protein [candidate division KSB1 bacterium]|nr:aldehyde dehydrogenase family protein [candidate division KSB1 bacterium]